MTPLKFWLKTVKGGSSIAGESAVRACVSPLQESCLFAMEIQSTDAQVEPTSRVQRWAVGLVASFAVLHAAYLVTQILPYDLRPRSPWRGLVPAYETITGCEQEWVMFETIPSYHAFDAVIQVKDQKGEIRELGPVLPGMRRYRDIDGPRLHNLMDRLKWEGKFLPFQVNYLKKMDGLLKERHLLNEGDIWTLRFDLDYTRHLFHIRKDGQLSLRTVKEFSPPKSRPFSP